MMTPEQKEARKLSKSLETLTVIIRQFEAEFGRAIQEPSSVERGRKLGRLVSALCYANDRTRAYGLGINAMRDAKKLPPGYPTFLTEYDQVKKWLDDNEHVVRDHAAAEEAGGGN